LKPISNATEFSEFLASRRTTRDFLPNTVPSNVIDELIKDALTAPSWSNTRPFKIAIATGEKRDRISAEFQSRWRSLSKSMNGGYLEKIKLLFRRKGLPTSNRSIVKPYVPELKP